MPAQVHRKVYDLRMIVSVLRAIRRAAIADNVQERKGLVEGTVVNFEPVALVI